MNNNVMVIQKNVSLKDKNWFKTGGVARFYCEPKTRAQLQEAFAWARAQHLEIHVLGQGANTLVSDTGFDGLVIHPTMANWLIKNEGDGMVWVQADAGLRVSDLISACLDQNIVGLEELSGIPGSIGGSVYNNLHYFEFSLSDFLDHATVLEIATGNCVEVTKEWLGFGYDHSILHEKKHVLVDATFKLKKVSDLEAAYAKGRSAEIIRHRIKRYPKSHTCGCFFRNFLPNELESEDGQKKLPYISYYLDLLGIKGTLKVGGAQVSSQHANMIVNTGSATTTDIVEVACTMQKLVYEKFGLMPHPECELVGFARYPFMK